MSVFTFSESTIASKVFVHAWTIKNFKEAHPGVGQFITSDGYVNEKRVWDIQLYPDGYSNNHREYIGICLSFLNQSIPIENLPYLFTIHIIKKNKMEHEVCKSNSFSGSMTNNYLVLKTYLLDETNELLQNGNLTLRFKIHFNYDDAVKPESIQTCSSISNSRISGFESIFNKEEFSDVKIVVGEKVFWAYKGILSTQSPVFAAMFEHDMKENNENKIEITDIDHEVVEEMLRFIYVGKVDNIEKIASNLLVAADKYEIKDLKLMCEETLISELTVERVLAVWFLAVKYEARLLKEAVEHFLKVHATEIVQSTTFKAYIKRIKPELLDIIELLVL